MKFVFEVMSVEATPFGPTAKVKYEDRIENVNVGSFFVKNVRVGDIITVEIKPK